MVRIEAPHKANILKNHGRINAVSVRDGSYLLCGRKDGSAVASGCYCLRGKDHFGHYVAALLPPWLNFHVHSEHTKRICRQSLTTAKSALGVYDNDLARAAARISGKLSMQESKEAVSAHVHECEEEEDV